MEAAVPKTDSSHASNRWDRRQYVFGLSVRLCVLSRLCSWATYSAFAFCHVASPFSNVVRKKLTDIFQDKTVWTHTKKLQIGSGILNLWAVKVSGASFLAQPGY